MTDTVTSPADVINIALRRVGYKLRVGNLLDGSEASTQALDIYAQTRDDMLRAGNWDFAQRDVDADELRAAPVGGYFNTAWSPYTHPPLPWRFAYEYPEDCLKVRILKPQAGFLFDPAPTPTLFSIVNVPERLSALSSAAVNAAGTGYVPGDYVYPTGGTQVEPPILQVSTTKVVSAAVAAGGATGTPGTQTVTGTTGTGTKFQASVTVNGGGAISAVLSITVAGAYTVNPTTIANEPVTGAGLVGARLSVVLGANAVSVVKAGLTDPPNPSSFTQGSTSGSGSGATFNTLVFTTVDQPQRVIVGNLDSPIITYTGQVVNPTQWPSDFVEALAAALGRRLAPVLVSMNAVELAARDEVMETAMAKQQEG